MIAIRCFKLAALYLILGMSLGVYMGATHQFILSPVHAHINLLGWVCLLLAGLLFTRFPHLAATRLAQVFFWVFNISLPISMLLLALVQTGNLALAPVLGMSSVAVWVGGVSLALNVLLNLKAADISA
jgi:Protein of unknown function (DUF2871)